MTRKLAITLLGIGFVLVCGCKKGGSSASMDFRHNKDGKGTVVAEIGSDSITAEELKKKLSDLSPFARARYQTLEQKKEYLEGITRFELMAQEALKRGLQNDPDVVDAAKKQMVQKLLQKEINEKPSTVPDDEIQKYYDAHKTDYVKPEMVRVAQIYVSAAKANSAEWKKKKAKAEEVLAQATKLSPFDFAGFNKLAKENSDDPKAQSQDTDVKYITVEELTTASGPEFAKAVADIKANGGLSPVIETEKGFYIAKLQGRQSALNLTVDQVKQPIQSRIQSEKRTQSYNQFVDSLKKNANYKVHEDVLAKVEVDANAPSTAPNRGGPPGMMPQPPGPVSGPVGGQPSGAPPSSAPPTGVNVPRPSPGSTPPVSPGPARPPTATGGTGNR